MSELWLIDCPGTVCGIGTAHSLQRPCLDALESKNQRVGVGSLVDRLDGPMSCHVPGSD